MTTRRLVAVTVAALLCTASASRALSDTFGNGANTFDIEFVTIGNPGNVADTTGEPNPAGSVPYTYRMGKFEISEQMIDKANEEGGLGIAKDTRGPDKPATSVSWFEAATFVNWLNTSTGNTPAYKFNAGNFELWQSGDAGYNPANLYRNSLAKYFLPSVDEWYKAAYFDPTIGVYFDYPTGSDTAPIPVASGTAAGTAVYDLPFNAGPADITLAGGLSPYGTMGQGGNVQEWEETDFDLVNDLAFSARGIRGGIWEGISDNLSSSRTNSGLPSAEGFDIGFRVASISEPDDLGDYNHDDFVDAADYVVWRKNGGTSEEYTIWRTNFGTMLGSGSAIATSAPEPSTLLLGAMAGVGLFCRRRSAG